MLHVDLVDESHGVGLGLDVGDEGGRADGWLGSDCGWDAMRRIVTHPRWIC